MFEHSLCFPLGEALFFDFCNKFSNFDFIRDKLKIENNIPALHRCFSLARDAKMATIVLENINPEGIIQQEIEDLKKSYSRYECRGLFRISFWKEKISSTEQWNAISDALPLGYLILKKDFISEEKEFQATHVFEAVFADSTFCSIESHRFNHCATEYSVKLVDKVFKIKGIMFAQQNGLSKCCAHVALYSILSMHNERELEPSFVKMNTIIGKDARTAAKGLQLADIKKILDAYGIQYTVYPRKKYPFNRIVYSGIESGGGVLLAFSTSSNLKLLLSSIPLIRNLVFAKPIGHIIPCWGHVFEKDIWTPMASRHYFKNSHFSKTKYYASDNWTSHFIAHDDNFGCNLLIPRDYFKPMQIYYCIAIQNKALGKYTSIEAEVQALAEFEDIYMALEPEIIFKPDAEDPNDPSKNSSTDMGLNWLKRLRENIDANSLILRTFSSSKEEYLEHLRNESDWHGNKESEETLNDLEDMLKCSHIWITEISVPQLFSSNERKLCEVIGDPNSIINEPREYALLVRMPMFYVMKQKIGYTYFESKLISHIHNLSAIR